MDFIFGVTPGDIGYDIETYPNVFTCTFMHCDTREVWRFEVSPRCNQLLQFVRFVSAARDCGCRLVGFNNLGFDYPVVHMIMKHFHAGVTVKDIYTKAMSIIKTGDRFAHVIWDSDHIVTQIDLFKIHHFDNKTRTTSLKDLEFNMGMANIEDLPFPVGIDLHGHQIDVLLDYNEHDVQATVDFYHESKDLITFREELSTRYNHNFLNHNDTKIGKDYFVMCLEDASPGSCYYYDENRKRQPRQTHRHDGIRLGDIIFPYIQFDSDEFKSALEWFKNETIYETRAAFTERTRTYKGFNFDFGTGGIHGSVSAAVIESDSEWIIEDWDVASYYPNLAISHGLFPEHLGRKFCEVYGDVYRERQQHAKGTAPNGMLKLALNGVYGDSNNVYSPFFDPQYTMSITVNGQLLLCMLAEKLMSFDPVQMIQINTDGLTIRYPRKFQTWVHEVAKWWEAVTRLTLEVVEYKSMFIRDVNNYIAVYTDGKTKNKGAYQHTFSEGEWHKDRSMLVVRKAAEARLVHGTPIEDFIEGHANMLDFMLRQRVTGGSELKWGGETIGRVARYYVSTDGDYLEKLMPAVGPVGQFKKANKVSQRDYDNWHNEWGNVWNPDLHTKNQSTYEDRLTALHGDTPVMVANVLPTYAEFDSKVDRNWYVREAEKLVNPILYGSES